MPSRLGFHGGSWENVRAVIYVDPEKSYPGFGALDWREEKPDLGGKALTFLQGEGSILCVQQLSDGKALPSLDDERAMSLVQALTEVVTAARSGGLMVAKTGEGHILLRAESAPALLFDGRTAEVLDRVLAGKETSFADRMQMTIRGLGA